MNIMFSMADGKQYKIKADQIEIRYDLMRIIPTAEVIAIMAHGHWELTEYAKIIDGLEASTGGDLIATILIIG